MNQLIIQKLKPKLLVSEFFLQLAILNVKRSGLFNANLYLHKNEDIAKSGVNPIKHFLSFGEAENRVFASSPQKQEKAKEAINNLYFVRIFRRAQSFLASAPPPNYKENIKIIKRSGLFNSTYYLEMNPDVREAGLDPITHFVMYGYREGRNPNSQFDTLSHAVRSGIPPFSNINPFVHFIENQDNFVQYGGSNASSLDYNHSIPFDKQQYVEKYPDLRNSGIDATDHFVSFGRFEGRDAGTSVGGYAEWRKSFVCNLPARVAGDSIKQNFPKISVCLVFVPGLEDKVDWTLQSIHNQGYKTDLIVLGNTTNVDLIDGRIGKFPNLRFRSSRHSEALSELIHYKESDYILFISVGDQILPDAIGSIRSTLALNSNLLILYSDEEILDAKSLSIWPEFKGNYNPELQLERDYTGNLLCVSTKIISQIEPAEIKSWPMQRFLMTNQLFAMVDDQDVYHLPKVLYRRNNPESWSVDELSRVQAGIVKVLEKNWDYADVKYEAENLSGRTVLRKVSSEILVSIIIPTRNGLEVLKPCIESILNYTVFRNFEIIIVDNGSDDPSTLEFLSGLEIEYKCFRVLRHDYPFNYSELNNLGVKNASGDIFVFLNNDIEVVDGDWLDELAALSCLPGVGAVGPLLLYPDGTIQHAGVVLGVGGVAAHSFSGLHPDSEEFGPHKHNRRVAAVTGACMAMSRTAFDIAGGFDEQNLPVDFSDIDICLKLSERGLRVLFTPHVTLIHHESKTRVSYKENSSQARRFEQEIQWMQLRWFNALSRDPYYNSNFSFDIPGYRLAWPPRERTVPHYRTATSKLDMYATVNNSERASEVVRFLAKDSSSISSLKTDIKDRQPGLSIVILNLDKPEFIIPLVKSLLPVHEHFNKLDLGLEILIGDTGTTDSKVWTMYQSSPDFVKVVDGLDYQFSRCNNQVFALESQYETILFLNNDIAFEGNAAKTLFDLYQFLDTTPDAGTVGAQLLFPERKVQHAGIGVFETGELRCFVYHPDSKMAPLDESEFPRRMWAVTGACLMIKASDFVSVGGFDEGYRTECQDAALCLEVHRRGKRSYVLSPDVIYHFENGTREKGSEDWADRQRFMRHWSSWIDLNLAEGGP